MRTKSRHSFIIQKQQVRPVPRQPENVSTVQANIIDVCSRIEYRQRATSAHLLFRPKTARTFILEDASDNQQQFELMTRRQDQCH